MGYNSNPVATIERAAPVAYVNCALGRIDGQTTAKVGALNLLATNPTHVRIIERCSDADPVKAAEAIAELKNKLVLTFKMANGTSSAAVDF
jgi:hypothetical protein